MKTYTVKITELQAEKLGILRCKSCGHPKNNHFNFDNKPCAHYSKELCKGYIPEIYLPA